MDIPGATPIPTPPPPAAATGLSDNVAGALAYVTIIPAIVFLVLEPYNRKSFVRFHAFQCLLLAACGIVLSFVFGLIPFIGWFLLMPLLSLAMICAWLLCAVKAYQGLRFKLPVLGNYAENMAG
jgi:uncharacterized membrane protein